MNLIKKHTPIFLRKISPLFRGELCKSPLVPPDKCHSHESGNPVEIRDCGFPIPDISRKKKEMNIKMKKGNKMLKSMINSDLSGKTRPFKIIFLLLGISLFISSIVFAGPNENAGIVFDLNATTYGNQNLTSIPSQPAGTYIRLDVYCTGVQNLDTYEFDIIYDPTELAYVAASASNLITFEQNILTTNGGTAIGWMIDTSTSGVLSIAYTLAGTDTLEAPEGEGLIADLVLQALVPSQDLLTFGDVQFFDSFGVLDTITNKGVALLSNYGNVDGTVTDANTGESIEGALITATSQDKFEYTGFTNAVGYYIIDSLIAGNYTVICDAADKGYNIAYAYNVEISADDTTHVDFALTSPIMVVEPLEIFPIVENIGDSTIADITISNIGTGPLDWRRTIVKPEQLREPLKIEFPTPSPGNYYTPIKVALSLGFAPEIIHTNHSEPIVNLSRGSTAWAYDTYPGEYFFSFDTDTPGTANIINSSPNWASYAGDFDADSDDTTYYIIKYSDNILARVDIETGVATDIGPIIGSGGNYNWTGMSCDKSTGIMYAVESNLDFTNLYTIDLATGTPTLIGATGIPCVIDIAVDGEGIIWGYDIVGDNMYTLDPNTGNGMMIGPIGFDANYAQGMSWDPKTDQVYLAAFHQSCGEFRVLDRETGYCAYVGPLHNNAEVDALGFIGGGWINVVPTSGTIEPGDEEIVQAKVYWKQAISPGEVKYTDIIFTPDPNCGEQTVNVQATFGNPITGTLDGTVTELGYTVPLDSVFVTAMPAKVSTYTNSAGYYIFGELCIGTYNLTFEKEGYHVGHVENVEIFEDNTTTVNFNLTQPTMDITPTSISETVPPDEPLQIDIHIVNNGDGELAWDASIIEPDRGVETDYSNFTTGILEAKNDQANGGNESNGFVAEENFKDDITLHYDGPNFFDIGLDEGGTFMAAARFTPKELGDYYGDYQLSNVEIFIYDMPIIATLKVWEGGSMGDPGTEIYSEDITGQISQQSWTTITLSAPIALVSDNEYWVGYEVTHNGGLFPAGCDIGPAVDEKGDWLYIAPGPWGEMQYSGYDDYNWNIRAVLSSAWITLTHNSGIVEAGGDSTVTVYFNSINHTIGEILQATIDFVSTPDVGTTSIPVTVTVGDIGVTGEPEILVTELLGNFPNPFSSSTMIQFSLKEDSHVKLSVYNIKGQLVHRLIDQDMVARADYHVEWSGTSNDKKLANGIYFYKLDSGNKTFLKKMILMK